MRVQVSYMNNRRIKNETERQRRERVLITVALKKLGLRYWESVWIRNPFYTSRHDVPRVGDQWIDFIIVAPDKRLFAIEFYPKWGRHNPHIYQKRWLEQKLKYLESKGIPVMVVRRMESGQDYYGRILMFLHSAKRRG